MDTVLRAQHLPTGFLAREEEEAIFTNGQKHPKPPLQQFQPADSHLVDGDDSNPSVTEIPSLAGPGLGAQVSALGQRSLAPSPESVLLPRLCGSSWRALG